MTGYNTRADRLIPEKIVHHCLPIPHEPEAYEADRKSGMLIEVCQPMQRRILAVDRAKGRSCSKCNKMVLT